MRLTLLGMGLPFAIAGLALLAALVAGPRLQAQAEDGAWKPKNMKVLSGFKTKDEVKAYMDTVADSLGVKCNFCHNTEDFPSDENKHKLAAREMMKMVEDINAKYLSKINEDANVSCFTCHRGEEKPAKKGF